MKCCSKEMIQKGYKIICKTCGYELMPLFERRRKLEDKELTKKEKLRKVFVQVISEYIHKNIPIDLHNIEVLATLLLKEVTMRYKH